MQSIKIFISVVLCALIANTKSQNINFSDKKKSSVKKSTSRKDQDVKSKTFNDENGIRAASTCYNCECQCDSYAWTNAKGQLIGNCGSEDSTGAKFCYVSGTAKRACRDVQQSSYRRDSFNGQKKFYSYEACVTPTRNQCYQYNQQSGRNCGDGDYNNGGGNNNGGYPGNNNGGYPNNNGGYPNNNGGYPNNNGGYPNNNNGGYPSNNGGYPSNNGGYPNNNGGYPSNGNGGYPSNNGGYPSNGNGGYPSSNNGGDPSNGNGGYPSNNNGGYPSNNNNGYPGTSWTLQSQVPGLGSPRSDKDKDTSITFGA